MCDIPCQFCFAHCTCKVKKSMLLTECQGWNGKHLIKLTRVVPDQAQLQYPFKMTEKLTYSLELTQG